MMSPAGPTLLRPRSVSFLKEDRENLQARELGCAASPRAAVTATAAAGTHSGTRLDGAHADTLSRTTPNFRFRSSSPLATPAAPPPLGSPLASEKDLQNNWMGPPKRTTDVVLR